MSYDNPRLKLKPLSLVFKLEISGESNFAFAKKMNILAQPKDEVCLFFLD